MALLLFFRVGGFFFCFSRNFLCAFVVVMVNKTENMTDLEKFVETYKQFGIKLHLNINPEGHTLVFLGYEGFQGDYKVTGNEKFEGYIGFHSDLVFDENGKFLSQGFWE